MSNISLIGTTAQSPPATSKAVTDLRDAIRNARLALHNGPLDSAIIHLEKASRLAAEVRNPHARQLGNFASALAPASETVQLVEMCLLELFPKQ